MSSEDSGSPESPESPESADSAESLVAADSPDAPPRRSPDGRRGRRRRRAITRDRRSSASAACCSPVVIWSASVHAAGFNRSASASSAARRSGSAVRCASRSLISGCHLSRKAICSSGLLPSIVDGTCSRGTCGATGDAAGDEAGGAVSVGVGVAAATGSGGAGAAWAVSPSSRRGRRRRKSGAGSMTCCVSRTAFQSNWISGCCASICRITSRSSGRRPTRTPPGVLNM